MNADTPTPNPLARIRQDVQSMHAYAVQDSAGLLKMDAMENPHRLPASLQTELGQRLGQVAVNRYPGARIDELRAALHAHAAPPASIPSISASSRVIAPSLPTPAGISLRS